MEAKNEFEPLDASHPRIIDNFNTIVGKDIRVISILREDSYSKDGIAIPAIIPLIPQKDQTSKEGDDIIGKILSENIKEELKNSSETVVTLIKALVYFITKPVDTSSESNEIESWKGQQIQFILPAGKGSRIQKPQIAVMNYEEFLNYLRNILRIRMKSKYPSVKTGGMSFEEITKIYLEN